MTANDQPKLAIPQKKGNGLSTCVFFRVDVSEAKFNCVVATKAMIYGFCIMLMNCWRSVALSQWAGWEVEKRPTTRESPKPTGTVTTNQFRSLDLCSLLGGKVGMKVLVHLRQQLTSCNFLCNFMQFWSLNYRYLVLLYSKTCFCILPMLNSSVLWDVKRLTRSTRLSRTRTQPPRWWISEETFEHRGTSFFNDKILTIHHSSKSTITYYKHVFRCF